MQYQYYPVKYQKGTTSYRLFILIEGHSRTASYLIEKAVITDDVIELTYYESNENVESADDAWTNRAAKTYAVKTDFKAPFAIF